MCYVYCFYLKVNVFWCPSTKICSAKRMCLKDIMRLSTFSATAGFSGRFNFLYVPVCFREKNSLCYLAPTFGTEVRRVSARETLCVNLVTWIWKKLTQWRCMPRIVCLVTYNIISIVLIHKIFEISIKSTTSSHIAQATHSSILSTWRPWNFSATGSMGSGNGAFQA